MTEVCGFGRESKDARRTTVASQEVDRGGRVLEVSGSGLASFDRKHGLVCTTTRKRTYVNQ